MRPIHDDSLHCLPLELRARNCSVTLCSIESRAGFGQGTSQAFRLSRHLFPNSEELPGKKMLKGPESPGYKVLRHSASFSDRSLHRSSIAGFWSGGPGIPCWAQQGKWSFSRLWLQQLGCLRLALFAASLLPRRLGTTA